MQGGSCARRVMCLMSCVRLGFSEESLTNKLEMRLAWFITQVYNARNGINGSFNKWRCTWAKSCVGGVMRGWSHAWRRHIMWVGMVM